MHAYNISMYMYIHAHTHIYIKCIYIYIHTYTYVYVYEFVAVYDYIYSTSLHIHVPSCECMYMDVHVCVCVCVCLDGRMIHTWVGGWMNADRRHRPLESLGISWESAANNYCMSEHHLNQSTALLSKVEKLTRTWCIFHKSRLTSGMCLTVQST